MCNMNRSIPPPPQRSWVVPREIFATSSTDESSQGNTAREDGGYPVAKLSAAPNDKGEDLFNFSGVDLIKVGSWNASTGPAVITRADLAAAVAAAPLLPDPVIKLGHIDPRFDGSPALGRVTNLRLSDRGSLLIGDFEDMPEWLAKTASAAFPQRSIEGIFNYTTNGQTYRLALTAVALLGAEWPAVTDLQSLKQLLERK